jgi:hypothetical protein
MRGLHMREEPPKCVANASRVTDFGKGLDEPGVNRDSASSFV